MSAQCVTFQGLTEIGNLPLSINAVVNSSFELSPPGQRAQGTFTQDNNWGFFTFNNGGGTIFVEAFPNPGSFCGSDPANQVRPRTGNNCIKMFGGFTGGVNGGGAFSDRISVAGGQNYVGGMYALSPSPAGGCPQDALTGTNEAVISVEFFDANNNCMNVVSGRFTSADATGEWIRYEAYAQAPPDATEALINIIFIQQANFDGGAVYFDDAFFHQVQTPTAPTMGEWGIMILGLLILIIGIVAIKQTSFSLTKTAA